MRSRLQFRLLVSLLAFFAAGSMAHAQANRFQLKDIFDLEFASDPQISPDGSQIVYVRNFFDIMTDRQRSHLWTIQSDGTKHRPLTTGKGSFAEPRWSPDGTKLVYVSQDDEGKGQIFCRWMDTGQTAQLSHLPSAPSGLSWSPDGKQIAFSMFLAEKVKPFIKLPDVPKGAQWADPPKVIRSMLYRADGKGYAKDGYHHLFVVPADDGTPRQLTDGPYHHTGAPAWTHDSQALIFSANRLPDWEHHPRESEVFAVSLPDKKLRQLTKRTGPDLSPTVSVDGERIAYLGHDDRYQGYQNTGLYVMNRDGSGGKLISGKLDRTVSQPIWHKSSSAQAVFVQYDDLGTTKLARVSLNGDITTLADNIGGATLGRPYASGSYSVAALDEPRGAFTLTGPQHPADVAIFDGSGKSQRLTHLNDDLFAGKELGTLEELWYQSAFDDRKIQGWILKPPGFDTKKRYPLILEIHGGPFANYGPRFAAEMQFYAAAGYVVFYCNPRGSTGYGEEFGNLIHHNYPSQDYDDLMSGVDAVLKRGYIDEANLFVTGGSGGGVLTAWIIGKTNRFRAAVVGKPVINWFSFVLTADIYSFFNRYWFPGPPWMHVEHYHKRSPISLVGNVTTPTMILTGEEDHRTPISESEQFFQALKLRRIETVLVRMPGASHNIAARPSQLIGNVACVLKWFEDHKKK